MSISEDDLPAVDSENEHDVKSPELRFVQMRRSLPADALELEDLVSSNGNFNRRETRCYLCKSDHDPSRCPLASICWRCMRKGHMTHDCPNQRDNSRCTFCVNPSMNHHPMQCPHQWRQYIYKESPRSEQRALNMNSMFIYCYMCGDEGHFGDDCQRKRGNKSRVSPFNALSLNQQHVAERREKDYVPIRRQSLEHSSASWRSSSRAPSVAKPRHERFSAASPSRSRSRSRTRSDTGSSPLRWARTRSRSPSDRSNYSYDSPPRRRSPQRSGSRWQSDRQRSQDNQAYSRDRRGSSHGYRRNGRDSVNSRHDSRGHHDHREGGRSMDRREGTSGRGYNADRREVPRDSGNSRYKPSYTGGYR
ncbi:hypothetical protein DFJ77DRAFT_333702 [Powellomyces hirtus]|nr:hypothetical protein DFJ77DRAFT_333702 [Powellomyces hirtus]